MVVVTTMTAVVTAVTTTAYVNQGDASDDTSRGSYTSVITAMEVVA